MSAQMWVLLVFTTSLIIHLLGCRKWRRDVSDSISTLPYIPYMSYIVHQISVEQYCNDFTFIVIVYCLIIIEVYAWEMLLSNIHYLINTV